MKKGEVYKLLFENILNFRCVKFILEWNYYYGIVAFEG